MKKGNKERGRKTLLTRIISNNNFLMLKGRYPKRVGAEKIIIIPYTGISNGWKMTETIFDGFINRSFGLSFVIRI
jgi:hypothetical protein